MEIIQVNPMMRRLLFRGFMPEQYLAMIFSSYTMSVPFVVGVPCVGARFSKRVFLFAVNNTVEKYFKTRERYSPCLSYFRGI